MENVFLGIPEFVWIAAFNVLEVLVVGLLLGAFATKYQKRKEIEYGLQGEIVRFRITAYQRIIKSINEIYHSIAPPSVEQQNYDMLLDGMPFVIPMHCYPLFLESQEKFDLYYKKLSHLCNEEHIFLDANVEYRLNQYLNYLTEIKFFLDAFCDLEKSRTDIPNDVKNELINLSYQSFGIALSNDFGRFYNNIDNTVAKEVSSMSLGFKNKRLKFKAQNIWQFLALHLVKGCYSKYSFVRFLSNKVYNLIFATMANSTLSRYPNYLIILLMRIHYSPEYDVESFNGLAEDTRSSLIAEFHNSFISLYHVR